MRKLCLALALIATVMLLHPVAASANRVVVLGGGPVIGVVPGACGVPGYAGGCGGCAYGYGAPGYYSGFGFGPDLRVYDPIRYYRLFYGQYFSPRSETIRGFTLPGRR
jgi:hypothetical protein